ncbi:MAG TPA: hypothetical protein VNV18_02690 [Stellaceae bacterium]|jgi:hypothetical protein|nr:hypothetical protein [Stellaceae bacterium]
MSAVRELLDDAIALQKDGLSPGRIGLALTDRWEAEQLESEGEVRRTRSKTGALELRFPSGEKIVWDGAAWSYLPA